MSRPTPTYTTLDDWIAREAISFSLDSTERFNAGVDRMMAALGDSVELLGLGEATHGEESILHFRNRLFERLVAAHGFGAIAIESSFTRAAVVNDYLTGRGGDSFEAVLERGFSHGFGRLEANRQLIAWMRAYNQRVREDGADAATLRFYGFDSPTEMTGADSPRQAIQFVLGYLESVDAGVGEQRRRRIEELLGQDADWENPQATFDPGKSIGLSPAVTALRIEMEELITELGVRRPELVARSDPARFLEVAQHAAVARQMLTYHAALARASEDRIARLLGIRDLMMADNLAYALSHERALAGGPADGPQRGKRVLAFAHNSHLQRGMARWQLGPHALAWWPAGAQINQTLGRGYGVVGCAVGVSQFLGAGQPEAGTIEAHLLAAPGPARLVPTHRGEQLSDLTIENLPTRLTNNPGYFPLTPDSLRDFDWLVMLS